MKHLPYRYRDFSRIAAEAVLAAGEQGKFWEMHWMLHRKYPELDRDSLIRYAEEMGLDIRRFRHDIDGRRHSAEIEEDLRLARRLDLYRTPAFFINGLLVVGNRPYEYFRDVIERELERALKQGGKRR